MQYNIHCQNTYDNFLYLKISWFNPSESIHEWCLYIDSYLEQEHLQFAIAQLSKVTWLFVTEKKITAKELDYLYTLRNVQYRLWRFTREIRSILCCN